MVCVCVIVCVCVCMTPPPCLGLPCPEVGHHPEAQCLLYPPLYTSGEGGGEGKKRKERIV